MFLDSALLKGREKLKVTPRSQLPNPSGSSQELNRHLLQFTEKFERGRASEGERRRGSLPRLPPQVAAGAAGPPCPAAAGSSRPPPRWGTAASQPLGLLWESSPRSPDPQQALPAPPLLPLPCPEARHGTDLSLASLPVGPPWSRLLLPAARSAAGCAPLSPR